MAAMISSYKKSRLVVTAKNEPTLSLLQLAERFDLSVPAVSRILREAGITMSFNPFLTQRELAKLRSREAAWVVHIIERKGKREVLVRNRFFAPIDGSRSLWSSYVTTQKEAKELRTRIMKAGSNYIDQLIEERRDQLSG